MIEQGLQCGDHEIRDSDSAKQAHRHSKLQLPIPLETAVEDEMAVKLLVTPTTELDRSHYSPKMREYPGPSHQLLR